MIPLSIQEVRNATVDHDISPDGDTILVLVHPEMSLDEYISSQNAFTELRLSDSMIVHTGLSDDENEDDEVGEHPPDIESEINQSAGIVSVSYRVHKKRLCHASTYFKNLFMGPWFENTYFEREGGIKIHLWEEVWDRNALLILLRIFHYELSDVPEIIDLKLLERIVIIADYLLCTDFLRDFLIVWGADALSKFRRNIILGIDNNILVVDGIVCTFISWKLCLRDELRMDTKALVLWSQFPLGNLGLSVDQSIIDAINVERERMLGQVIEPLKTEIRNLATYSFYALQRDSHASVIGFSATAQHVRTLLGLDDLSELPEPPYIGHNVISVVDNPDQLRANFRGLNIDDF